MELIIRSPLETECPMITSLWEAVFADGPAFTVPFLETAEPARNALCAFERERLVGMLFLLPAVLSLSGEAMEARYLYGAATAPDFRGRGVFRRLEQEAARAAREAGARAIGLVPAEPGLYQMYQKLGYRTRFWLSETLVPAMIAPKASIAVCREPDFLALRREMLRRRENYFDLYPALCEFRYREFVRAGGEILYIQTPEGNGYTAGRPAGEEYRIAETSLSGLALAHAAGAIRLATGARRVRVTGKEGARRPAGMVKLLDDTVEPRALLRADPYLNLMLT